ncbi:PorT family protein [Flavobacteriales bacterium]|nr:PorT family protein [Flavobacteriales bacterium]
MRRRILIIILFCFVFSAQPQNNRTTFGLQYKPIIPAEYFNSSHINESLGAYSFNLIPKYSNSFGMVIRHKINKTFSIESGLNYIQRNFKLTATNNSIDLDAFTAFNMRSYELPIQLLTYVRASEYWYLNVAFGISHNVLASDIFSYSEENQDYFQNTYRKSGGYRALLANVGMEYRTESKGHYYFGTSLHRPWKAIAKIYPNDKTNFNSDDKFSLEMLGNFVTVDFRYFFP